MSNKNIGIIDYGFGNLGSVLNALKYLDYNVKIIKKSSDAKNFSHLILPGVGSFKKAMEELVKQSWVDTLKKFNKSGGKILGICLGMQLLFSSGEEDGLTNGLKFFDGKCTKLNSFDNYPIPHIGFNSVQHDGTNIWKNINKNSYLYFVHSYAIKNTSTNCKCAYTKYGNEKFISYIENNNIFGAQFHPEKSHMTGLKFIKNFIET